MKNYFFLALAILFEVLATSALKSAQQFTKLWPSLLTVAGYLAAFYFLSLTLRSIPIGIAYAIWSGAGIVLITLAGMFVFGQVPDVPAVIGMLLIVAGVVVINVFSRTSAH